VVLITALVLGAAGAVATPARAAVPDERLDRIVYSSDRGAGFDLWAANVDGTDQVRLTTDPADDTQPDVSPDGDQIVFVRGAVRGSTPTYGYLWVMDADGSDAHRLLDNPVDTEFRPDFSPDGSKILYSRFAGVVAAPNELWMANADGTGEPEQVAISASFGSWSPDGTMVVHNRINLPDIQIGVTRLGVSGSVPLTSPPGNNVAPQWSPDGTRIVFTSYRNGDGEVWVMNADGSDQHVVAASPGKDGLATWSPDSNRIAFGSSRHTPCPPTLTELCPHQLFTMRSDGSDLRLVADNAISDMWPSYFPRSRPADRITFSSNREGSYDIYTSERDGSEPIRVTSDELDDIDPDASPDGTQIAFTRGLTSTPQSEGADIYVVNVDGTGERPLVDDPATKDFAPDWSPNGDRVLLSRQPTWVPGGGGAPLPASGLWVVGIDGTGLTQLTDQGTTGSWSPDGTRIVFSTWRSGLLEVWTMNADGTNQERLTDLQGFSPTWSPDGRSIAFSIITLPSTGEIHVWDLATRTVRKVTEHAGTVDRFPSWSPNSKSVIYASSRDDTPCGATSLATCRHQLYETHLARGTERRVATSSASDGFPSYIMARSHRQAHRPSGR
jgi:TolB protein